METAETLDRQIQVQLEELALLEGKERTEAINALNVLYQIKLDAMRTETERLRIESDAREGKRNRRAQTATSVLSTGASVGTTLYFLKKGFKFEETGVFTSSTFKQLLGKLLTVVKH